MKKFTLVELITTIVVISILAAIVMLSIQNIRDNAIRAEISSNVRNFETVRDIITTKDQNASLTEVKPELGSPVRINTDALYPEYIKSKPKHGIYWIDSFENIYGSIVDLPIIDQDGSSYSWEYPKNSEGMNVYQLTPSKKLKLVDTLNKSTSSFEGESGEVYFFSHVDKLGLETAPVEMYEEGEPKICPISLDTYRFTHNPDNLEEYHITEDGLSEKIFKTNDNKIIQFSVGRPFSAEAQGFYMKVILYNPDFEIEKHKVVQMEENHTFGSSWYGFDVIYFEHQKNGDYLIVTYNDREKTAVYKLDKNLNFIYGKEINIPTSSYARNLEVVSVEKISDSEILIAGNPYFYRPQLVSFNTTTGEVKNIVEIPLMNYSSGVQGDEKVHQIVKLENGNYLINTTTVFGRQYFKRKLIYDNKLELKEEIYEAVINGSGFYDPRTYLLNYKGNIYEYKNQYSNQTISKYDYNLNLLDTYSLGNYNPSQFEYDNNGIFYFFDSYGDSGDRKFNLDDNLLTNHKNHGVKLKFSIGNYSYLKYYDDIYGNYYYGLLRLKNSTVEMLKSENPSELIVEELELPSVLRHLPIDLRDAYDFTNPLANFDLMTNYNQVPINKGGNPYFPSGQVVADGLKNEILSITNPLKYTNDYISGPDEDGYYSFKDGFKDALVISSSKMTGFSQYMTIDSNGEFIDFGDFEELTIEEYKQATNVYLEYSTIKYDEAGQAVPSSKMYVLKGNLPSSITIHGEEKLPFGSDEESEITEGVAKEILSIESSLERFTNIFKNPDSQGELFLKDSFANSMIVLYVKDMGFFGYMRVDSNGEMGEPRELDTLELEDYHNEENIFLLYSSYESSPDNMIGYVLKGNSPSGVTVLGQEKLPFLVDDSETEEGETQYPYDVNPCYAGAYMFKADNMSVLYKVNNEGKLIPYANMDNFINPIDNLYYKSSFDTVKPLNPYNDVILYYLPNGSIVDRFNIKVYTQV